MPTSQIRRRARSALLLLPGGDKLLQIYRRTRRLGHRAYVGGMWDEIGKVQFDFMVRQGLKPSDVLVDVACGSLRGGRFFIEYLDPENYLGIDQHAWLIEAGLKREMPDSLVKEKRPQFVQSDRFEFHKFGKQPNLGIAQSLFSHLTEEDISMCLRNLKAEMEAGGKFYATFMSRAGPMQNYVNPDRSDDHQGFWYHADDLLRIGREAGWQARNIGDWGHPRGQHMLEFLA